MKSRDHALVAGERRDAAPGGDVPDPGRVVAGDAREAAVGEVRERVHPERVGTCPYRETPEGRAMRMFEVWAKELQYLLGRQERC